MGDASERLKDPEFRQQLKQRGRWRWGLSIVVIAGYLAYAVGGLIFTEAYGLPFPGTAIPRGLAFGFVIIFVSIALSAIYVRISNRLDDSSRNGGHG